MKIVKSVDNAKTLLAVSGRIDTVTAPELEAQISLEGVSELTFDLAGVEYISSAGLRLLVKTFKDLSEKGGSMKLANVRPIVREVFDITGFADKFTFV